MKEPRITYNKNCEYCGIEYQAGLPNARFCSARCRAANWRSEKSSDTIEREHQPDQIDSTEQEPEISEALSPGMQMLVDLLRDQCEYWENAYADERERSNEWEEKYNNTKAELHEQKLNQKLLNHKIDILQKAKPTGIDGLAENPFLLKLAEHVGPALAGLVTRLGDSKNKGSEKRPDPQANNSSFYYVQLPANLPEDRRIKIIEILRDMAALNLDDLDATIGSIFQLLKDRRGFNFNIPPVP